MSNLTTSLKLLQEDVQRPDSALVQAGESRVQIANETVKGISDTLEKLQKFSKCYQSLDHGSASIGRRFWKRFKWSIESSSIDRLRNKVGGHASPR